MNHFPAKSRTLILGKLLWVVGTTFSLSTSVQAQGITPRIATSVYSCLALHSDGSLWSWGTQYTAVPVNTMVNQLRPQAVPTPALASPGSTWTAIGVAGDHECAIRSDGTLWAWGFNNTAQLGDGTTVAQYAPTLVAPPTTAAPGTRWIEVFPVSQVTLALRSDSTLWSWGTGQSGLLGNGMTSGNQPRPGLVPVPSAFPGTHWSKVAASDDHVLALLSNGTLWAWGVNTFGQLGTAVPNGRVAIPTQVPLPPGTAGGTRWVALAAGLNFSLALRSDGSVWTWGENNRGQLGLGTVLRQTTPTQVPAPPLAAPGSVWTRVAAGDAHSLALRSDGSLWGWGRNEDAQLGDNSATDRTTPVQEFTHGRWAQIAGATTHSLALAQTTARVFATGGIIYQNNYGQLGDGTRNGGLYYRPCLVTALPTVASLEERNGIFPNPAREWATLVGVPPGTPVRVQNTLGQECTPTRTLAQGIDVRGWPPGVYWLTTQPASGQRRTVRLLIN